MALDKRLDIDLSDAGASLSKLCQSSGAMVDLAIELPRLLPKAVAWAEVEVAAAQKTGGTIQRKWSAHCSSCGCLASRACSSGRSGDLSVLGRF